MEAARAWTERADQLPQEVSALLLTHQRFGEVLRWCGEPEAKFRLDEFRGESRNTDIAIWAEDQHGGYLLAVEAKADEPFGATIAQVFAAARRRKLANPRSNGIARIEQLTTSILEIRAADDLTISNLRYQLLTATAGALLEAHRRELKRTVLLIHEFVTSKTNDGKHEENANDLLNFLSHIAYSKVAPPSGDFLLGPFILSGFSQLQPSVELFVGKVTRNLRMPA